MTSGRTVRINPTCDLGTINIDSTIAVSSADGDRMTIRTIGLAVNVEHGILKACEMLVMAVGARVTVAVTKETV